MSGLALALVIVMLTLAGLHFYWGHGGRWPGTDEPSLVAKIIGRTKDGRMPSTAMCLLVSLAFVAAAYVIAADRGGYTFGAPMPVVNIAYFLLVLVFIVRGVAAYIPGAFAYAQGTEFYVLNRRYYAPFCLLIAFLLMVALTGIL